MKAILVDDYGAPDVLELKDLPDLQPDRGQVLVRIHAAGVNPVETYMRTGNYPIKPPLPWTPGGDGAGEIVAVGQGVSKSLSVGKRVYTSGSLTGTYAQFALCDAATVHPLPENVSYAQGAAIGVPYATAHRALFGKARAQAGETVFIHGASGGVGIAAVQIARAAGLTVIGSAGTERGRQLVLQQGAHYVLDHHEGDYLQELLGINCGRGPDIILEMLANENLGKDLSVVALGGRIVVIGNRGTVEINPRDIMGHEATVLGMVLFNASPAEKATIHAALGAGLENGTLRPIIDREFPLEQAPQAHEAVLEAGSHGKIVLIP